MKAPILLVKRLCYLGLGLTLVAGLALAIGLKWSSKFSRRAPNLSRATEPQRLPDTAQLAAGQSRGKQASVAENPKRDQALFPTPQQGGDGGEDVEARLKWFLFKRTYPFDSLPEEARRQAFEVSSSKASTAGLLASAGWIPIGPVPTNSFFPNNWGMTSGRINAIAISPANSQLMLIGGATGGIWRSTDGGAHFAPVSDNQVDLAVQSIVFAPSNPQIVYAGMGDLGGYLGSGVLKSIDAGQTWTRVSNTTLPFPGEAAKIEVDPTNPNRVYLAQYISRDINSNGTFSSGFYLSTDGGVNWTRTLQGLPRDLVMHPTNPQILYLGVTRVDPSSLGLPAGIYRSTDSGNTWTNIFASPYNATSDVRVGVTAADTQRIYGYLGGTLGSSFDKRVVVSSDGGATWINRGGTGLDSGQFGYNTYLAVDPTNANTVYAGTRDVYRSTNAGVTWVNLNNSFPLSGGYTPEQSNAHPDQHSFAFLPGNSNTFFIGNDGGLYRTTNGGSAFQSLNNSLSLTMFEGYALHPTNAAISYGGTQDNGTQRRLNAAGQWSEFSTGDGGNCVIDPLNPSTVFTTYVYGVVNRFQDNGQTFDTQVASNATFGEPANGPRIAFYPPFTGNGVSSTLYFGTWRLFMSTNRGTSWSAPAGMTDLTNGGSDVLSAIGVARSNTNVIYTGSSFGRAMVSTDGGANWTDITTGLPNRFITSITVDPSNAAIAYLTVSGYASGHVFKTINTGATWSDLSGDLPNIPVNTFLIDPHNANTFYVGTDIGVFRSTIGGNSWSSFNTGLPPVIVHKLVTNPSGVIQAATYGRGAYELQTGGASNGFLYVFNQRTNALNLLFGFEVNEATGALTLLPGFPKTTGGFGFNTTPSEQLAIDRTNHRLYLLNDASDTLIAYSINTTTGALTQMPFSPLDLGPGNWFSLGVHPSGSPLVIGNGDTSSNLSGQLLSYRITATSATPVSGSPYNVGTANPFSIAFSQDGNYVYTGGNINNTFAGFQVNPVNGGLLSLAGSPFDSESSFPVAYATDVTGRLFMANGPAGHVRVFSTASGIPSPVPGNPFFSGLTSAAHGLLHPNGFYLVADRGNLGAPPGNRIGVYRVNGSGGSSSLTPVPGSPFPAGGFLTDVLAFNQAGTFLYAAHGDSRNISTFSFNSTTGALTLLNVQATDTLDASGRISGLAYLPGSITTCGTITLSPTTLPDGAVGTPYNQTISASPIGAYTFAVNSGALPAGLFLNTNTGAITGTPTTAGTSSFIITATNSSSCVSSQAYTIFIQPLVTCPTINSISPTSGAPGSTVTLSGSGLTGVSSVRFSNQVAASFTLINDSTITTTVPSGAVSGPLTMSKPGCADVQSSTFTVSTPCPSVSGISPASGVVGNTVTIIGAGFTSVSSIKFSNNVAASFTVLNDTAITTTVPSGAVTGPLTISKPGCANVQTTNFTIACPTITLSPTSLPSGTVNVAYNSTLITASGGTAPLSFTLNTGTLPNGLTLSPSGLLSGTPTQSGSFNLTLKATDANGCTGIQAYTIVIQPPVANCVPVSISTTLSGSAGGSLIVPIISGDLTGKGVTAYDFILSFNPSVLKPSSSPTDQAGTLSSGFNITPNSAVAGRISVSAFGTSPLSGAGTLLNLKFDVIGAANACSDLIWLSFTFNEGTPCATPSNGRACVSSILISGAINYGTATGLKPVPGVTLTVTGALSTTSITDNAGNYLLPNLGSGPYTVTPTKSGAINGISSLDASLVAQSVAGVITLTPNQLIAADASGNSAVTSFDASLIAQAAAGVPNSGLTGTWKFTPATRAYPTLSGNLTGQNFDAILVGDVSGNWSPPAGPVSPASQAAAQASRVTELRETETPVTKRAAVALHTTTGAPGASVTLPITVGELTGLKITAYDLTLSFDPSVLQLLSAPVETSGTLSAGLSVVVNNATPGQIVISAFGAQALSGAGTLLHLKFNVIGATGTSSALRWHSFVFNEGEVSVQLIDGRFTVNDSQLTELFNLHFTIEAELMAEARWRKFLRPAPPLKQLFFSTRGRQVTATDHTALNFVRSRITTGLESNL